MLIIEHFISCEIKHDSVLFTVSCINCHCRSPQAQLNVKRQKPRETDTYTCKVAYIFKFHTIVHHRQPHQLIKSKVEKIDQVTNVSIKTQFIGESFFLNSLYLEAVTEGKRVFLTRQHSTRKQIEPNQHLIWTKCFVSSRNSFNEISKRGWNIFIEKSEYCSDRFSFVNVNTFSFEDTNAHTQTLTHRSESSTMGNIGFRTKPLEIVVFIKPWIGVVFGTFNRGL